MRRALGFAFALALTATLPSRAQAPSEVDLNIRKGDAAKLPLLCESLVPGGDREARTTSVQADEVLANDLATSGVFDVSRSWNPASTPVANPQGIVSGRWTVNGSQVRLNGEVSDFPARRPILQKEYKGPVTNWRDLAHQFADDVVMQFTGEPGVARTRIAFAVRTGRNKELFLMDLDGANLRPLTEDQSLALSPSWSPDGSLLLYTSYRGGQGPRIFVLAPQSRRSFLVSGRAGNNTSPCYSPDGREIACTLSLDGNAEIYRLDARGGSPTRLTNNRAIDTSPSWSPTGREIAFTSDRSGSPQVYVMDRDGGNQRRLSFDVSYTDSPAWSPKGDRIAFVSRTDAGFDLYTCRPDGTGSQLVVSGGSNENPRWSPDGRHLVFASNRDGSYALYVSDLDGVSPRKLDTGGRRAFAPAWSPRLPALAVARP